MRASAEAIINKMHPSLLTLFLLSAPFVQARRTRIARQDGPIDPGIAADCTYFDTARDASWTCAFFEQDWGITHDNFIEWVSRALNP